MPNGDDYVDIDAAMDVDELLAEAFRKATREALLRHKLFGVPAVVWENGKIVWIPPEEIDPDAPYKSAR